MIAEKGSYGFELTALLLYLCALVFQFSLDGDDLIGLGEFPAYVFDFVFVIDGFFSELIALFNEIFILFEDEI